VEGLAFRALDLPSPPLLSIQLQVSYAMARRTDSSWGNRDTGQDAVQEGLAEKRKAQDRRSVVFSALRYILANILLALGYILIAHSGTSLVLINFLTVVVVFAPVLPQLLASLVYGVQLLLKGCEASAPRGTRGGEDPLLPHSSVDGATTVSSSSQWGGESWEYSPRASPRSVHAPSLLPVSVALPFSINGSNPAKASYGAVDLWSTTGKPREGVSTASVAAASILASRTAGSVTDSGHGGAYCQETRGTGAGNRERGGGASGTEGEGGASGMEGEGGASGRGGAKAPSELSCSASSIDE
jgi:hypothetical protein